MKRRYVVLCTSMVVLALAFLLAVSGQMPGQRPGTPQRQPESLGSALQASGLERAEGSVGSMVRYALDFSSVADLDARNKDAQAATITLKIRGSYRATLAASSPELRTYEVRIESPALDLGAGVAADQRAHLEQGLAVPHYAVFKASGQLVELLVPPDTDGTTHRIWFGIASALQFSPGEGEEWTATELDPAGEYLAEYQAQGAAHFEKRKLRYVRLRSENQWLEQDKITLALDGAMNITREGQDWPTRVVGQETAWTETGEQLIAMRVETRIDLQRVEVGHDSGAVAERLAQARAGLRAEIKSPTTAGGDIETDYQTLVETLKAKGTDPALLIQGFVAAFQKDPAAMARAVELLTRDPDADPTFAMINALSQVGTPEAQAALAELATDPDVRASHAEEALIELGRTAQPTDETVKTLRQALDDRRGSRSRVAALALGNAADSRGSDDLVAELSERLAQANDPEQIANLLLSLGNTARASAFGAIAPHLSTAHPILRATAAMALRLIPHEEAQPRLAGLLAGDSEIQVRAAAAAALGYRQTMAGLAALSAAVRGDAAPAVRSEAITALSKFATAEPVARDVIAWAAKNDRDAKVRQVAENLL